MPIGISLTFWVTIRHERGSYAGRGTRLYSGGFECLLDVFPAKRRGRVAMHRGPVRFEAACVLWNCTQIEESDCYRTVWRFEGLTRGQRSALALIP